VKTVVSPSGNINNNNYDNNNGVRPFWITDRRSRPGAETSVDTKRQVSFRLAVNTKVFLWIIKVLYAVLKTCIKPIERLKQEKDLMEAVHAFKP